MAVVLGCFGLGLCMPPESWPTQPSAAGATPFVWDRDELWEKLEGDFLRGPGSCSQLEDFLSRILKLEQSIATLGTERPGVSNPAWQAAFENLAGLAPVAAKCGDAAPAWMRAAKALRAAMLSARRSDSLEARAQSYRVLYGTRTAIEQVLLQLPPDLQAQYAVERFSAESPGASAVCAEVRDVTVCSGDVLLSRGGAPTSAMIARGNDYPGNFSHVALAYVDGDSRKVSLVEAHIERGVAISSAEEYLRDTKLRILLLRYRAPAGASPDPGLPHRAASWAMKEATRRHIPYDFEMDFEDPSKMFCSEVASQAYRQVGVAMWKNMSTMSSRGVTSWLAAMGVTHFRAEIPSDLEYDPQFVPVAEWRNLETLWQDQLDNAVIDAMIEEAERGARLDVDWKKLPLVRVLKAYSVLLNWLGRVGPVPEGMSPTVALRVDTLREQHGLRRAALARKAESFAHKLPYWRLVALARQPNDEIKE